MIHILLTIADVGFIIWLALSLIHFTINKELWAENVWSKNGNNYEKRETRSIRRRMVVHILLAITGYAISSMLRELFIM